MTPKTRIHFRNGIFSGFNVDILRRWWIFTWWENLYRFIDSDAETVLRRAKHFQKHIEENPDYY